MYGVNMHKVPAFLGCSNIPAMFYVLRFWWRGVRSCGSHKSGIRGDRSEIFFGRRDALNYLVTGALPGTACFTTPTSNFTDP